MKYGRLMPMEIEEELLKLLNKILRGGGLPRDWRRGIIDPIFKKGDRKAVKNYRGVMLLSTAYKIYTDTINERLKMQVEDQLEKGQVGFRQDKRTVDTIYILNYVDNREMRRRRGKLFACFIDLKAF